MRYTNRGARIWEPEEDDILRMKYPDTLNSELMIELDRSLSSIYGRAQLLGLSKSDAYIKKHGMRFTTESCIVGSSYRWKKGNAPPNKGKKLQGERLAKILQTAFKKGHIPHNSYAEDGVVIVRNESQTGKMYQWVRIALGKWKPVHILLWENKHGEYNKKTHCLWFINGDTMDVRLENLELITRAENVKRNRKEYLELPDNYKYTKKLIKNIKNRIEDHDKKHKH